jgi:hypothetical protein
MASVGSLLRTPQAGKDSLKYPSSDQVDFGNIVIWDYLSDTLYTIWDFYVRYFYIREHLVWDYLVRHYSVFDYVVWGYLVGYLVGIIQFGIV